MGSMRLGGNVGGLRKIQQWVVYALEAMLEVYVKYSNGQYAPWRQCWRFT